MRVVDAQIHLWQNAGGPPVHWPKFIYQDAIAAMDEAGVDVAVNCPPIWDMQSNDYAVEAHLAHPTRLLFHGWVDLLQPDSLERLRACKNRPGLIGLRFLTASPIPRNGSVNTMDRIQWPDDDSLDWFWAETEKLELPLAVCGHAILPHVGKQAELHPGLKITLDHFGAISMAKADGLKQLPDLLSLARFPNVAIKLTAAPSYASDQYPFCSLHDDIKKLYDSFGPQRLFWGSDVTRLPCSWRQCVTMFTEEIPWLSETDKKLIMGQSFCDWHGIACPS
jgi:predicted TIM-barrel fold metal-dependent hydrolase